MRRSTKPYTRADRLADQIKIILSSVFLNKVFIYDSGLITITKVTISSDLKYSKIFISFLDNKIDSKTLIEELNSQKKNIRYNLGKELQIKYVPEIVFHHDKSLKYASKINSLLQNINN